MMRGATLLLLVGLLAGHLLLADAQDHHKKKHLSDDDKAKKSAHSHKKEVEKALKSSEKDIKAEAKSNTNAAKAKETAILARAEVKASHLQTDADHKVEKAEGELADIAQARHKELKDQKKASKDYKHEVHHFKSEEKGVVKHVKETMKRAYKLTEHMPKAERAQYLHYAKQQAQHNEADQVAKLQDQASHKLKEDMWKQATREEKDETEYERFKHKEEHEAKGLKKTAKKQAKKAKKDEKTVEKQIATKFKEEKKMIEMTEKQELSKVKHEFYKNINRTTFTPAPRPETGDADEPFGTALAAEMHFQENQNRAILGLVALGCFMAAAFGTVAIDRLTRADRGARVFLVEQGQQTTQGTQAGTDPELGPAMYEPLQG